LQAAGCALSWCYPIENVVKKRSIFFDEGVKVFMLNLLKQALVRILSLSAKPAKRLVNSC